MPPLSDCSGRDRRILQARTVCIADVQVRHGQGPEPGARRHQGPNGSNNTRPPNREQAVPRPAITPTRLLPRRPHLGAPAAAQPWHRPVLAHPRAPAGRPAIHQRRELLNAMLYWQQPPAAPGGCCPMTCHHGRRSTTTFAVGDWRAAGHGWSGCFAPGNASARAGGHRLVRRSLIARACGPPKRGAARLPRCQEGRAAVSGTCWSTRWLELAYLPSYAPELDPVEGCGPT